jgi:hypothetical protein
MTIMMILSMAGQLQVQALAACCRPGSTSKQAVAL